MTMPALKQSLNDKRLAEWHEMGGKLWDEFAKHCDSVERPEGLRACLRAFFPFVQEKWQIYVDKRKQLIEKYRCLIVLLNSLGNVSTPEEEENKKKVIQLSREISSIAKGIVEKIEKGSKLHMKQIDKEMYFSSVELGYYPFEMGEGISIKQMTTFFLGVSVIHLHELAQIQRLISSAEGIAMQVQDGGIKD